MFLNICRSVSWAVLRSSTMLCQMQKLKLPPSEVHTTELYLPYHILIKYFQRGTVLAWKSFASCPCQHACGTCVSVLWIFHVASTVSCAWSDRTGLLYVPVYHIQSGLQIASYCCSHTRSDGVHVCVSKSKTKHYNQTQNLVIFSFNTIFSAIFHFSCCPQGFRCAKRRALITTRCIFLLISGL